MKNFFSYNRWVLGFIALAFVIRLPLLWHMDYTNFPEFYRDYYVSSQITRGHWPLAGPPSMQTDFRFGPVYYYLLAPLFWLGNKSPAALILTGILLYALSAGVCYKLFLRWFSDGYAAKLGALFYAVSIYGLHLTSYISNPNFLPLFVLLYFYYLTKILEDGGQVSDYIFLGLSYGIAAQIHATAALVLPLAGFVPIFISRKILAKTLSLKKIIGLVVSFILVSLPYLIYNIADNFRGVLALLNFSSGHLQGGKSAAGAQALLSFWSACLNPFDLNNGYTYLQPNSLYVIVAAAAAIVLALMIVKVFRYYSKIDDNPKPPIISHLGAIIVFSWLVAGCLMVLLFNRAIHDHYLIIFWPLPAVFVAFAGQWLKDKLRLTAGLVMLVLIISLLQAYSLFSLSTQSWSNFWPAYQSRYQNDPNTPNIGFSPMQQ
ncbi:MAG: glycosyltransferase family 39 protein [Candidatus Doudnabacteria bacterium]|nr:glycosyltransferase family 39 protein [Candidatus Doudnabacteria bacterium]